MGRELTLGELEILAGEEDGIRGQSDVRLGQLQERLDGVQESRSSAGLEDDLVGVDEEGGLRKDVGVKVVVAGRANDGAVDHVEDVGLPLLGKHRSHAIGLRRVRAEANLDLLFGSLESSVEDDFFVGHIS